MKKNVLSTSNPISDEDEKINNRKDNLYQKKFTQNNAVDNSEDRQWNNKKKDSTSQDSKSIDYLEFMKLLNFLGAVAGVIIGIIIILGVAYSIGLKVAPNKTKELANTVFNVADHFVRNNKDKVMKYQSSDTEDHSNIGKGSKENEAVKEKVKDENNNDNDIVLKQESTVENNVNTLDSELHSVENSEDQNSELHSAENSEDENSELHSAENSEDKKIDYSLWEDVYQRSMGPSATIIISTADDNGIIFTAGIGASGYMAYVDMREFYAEWTEEYMALYEDGSGYELYFALNEDGSIDVTENVPYYSGLGLAGFYTKEAVADFPDCEFVFPQSSDSYISAEACEGLNELECKIARNEIYARHGRKFEDEALQRYFDICSWYYGTIEPTNFSADVLNNFELENLKIIGEYEIKMGYK